LAAQVEVFAMGLFEGLTKRGDFRAVGGFQPGYFGGECGDDVVVGVFVGGRRLGLWPVLAALVFDPRSESSVVVEERVGDAGLALDGLECHRLAALDQAGDGGIGRSGLLLGFAAGRVLEDLDPLLAGIAHETRFR
jgi:hypothetical protein